MSRPAPACCLLFLLFLGPNCLILCLLVAIFRKYFLAIFIWIGARACLLTLSSFAKNIRLLVAVRSSDLEFFESNICPSHIYIYLLLFFDSVFFPQIFFLPIPLKTSPHIAPAADTKSSFAIAPRIGKKPSFCLFLPPKCQTSRLMQVLFLPRVHHQATSLYKF